MMNIEIVIQQRGTGRTFDISDLVSDINWSTDMINAQPGALDFEYIEDSNIIPHYGDFIRLRIDSRGVFFGRVFTKERSELATMRVRAYDLVRFLKNKHTYALSTLNSTQIFRRICNDFELAHRVVDASNYNLPAMVHDNESLFNILQDAFDKTVTARREWFFVRDNFGVLEHVNINSQQTSLVIGDNSMATGYEFTGSIADDTFNRVRLVRENEATMRREVYIVQDSRNINTWGLLQFHDTVDEGLNTAQIDARASLILAAKNRPTRELRITALGDLRVRAGSGIVLMLDNLRNEGFSAKQRALVCSCVHRWSSAGHLMELTLRVVN